MTPRYKKQTHSFHVLYIYKNNILLYVSDILEVTLQKCIFWHQQQELHSEIEKGITY